ncbi:hypothetical protein ACFFGH_33120 [Lysobacter korlensis]|uniref:Uncharacterized protein n=1 Tax=Lysobacter korlensis TaxID=553636 RepID=A0ABV6S0E1_9GAMM
MRFYDDSRQNRINLFESKQPEGIVAVRVGLLELDQRCAPRPVRTQVLIDQPG